MVEYDSCKAGIVYDSLKGIPFDVRPCFCNVKQNYKQNSGCSKAEFPTTEQIREQDTESTKRFVNVMKAREVIVKALGGPWKDGIPSSKGQIDCPICKCKKSLLFSRSGYNGHIHATCKTENCVSWME